MVNRVAVLLVGGIVIVAVVVIGGVAALVLNSGGGGGGTPTAVEATPLPSPGPTATPTPTPGAAPAATPTATVTPTATDTPTPTPRPTVSPSEFDEQRIELLVARLINERREAAGLEPLGRNGSLVADVTEMARDHSEAMARVGEATHVIDGNTSTDRYKAYDLYRNCQWKKPGEDAFARSDANGITASPNGFEAVARTVAGRPYEVDGETRFNADERAVARAVVRKWWNTTYPPYPERLTLPNARHLGVGVEVTQFGEVYVTANLC